MKNLAGVETCDADIAQELLTAGIPMENVPLTHGEEVRYTVIGRLKGWRFERAWYYWRASADEKTYGLNPDVAFLLNAQWCKDIRVNGNCMGQDVVDEWIRCYHIDTQEGLNALVRAILFAEVILHEAIL
jgi:hypothetical protein